eukprot:tig00000823_g4546.t1
MAYQLSAGAINQIVGVGDTTLRPTLQVVDIKKVAPTSNALERYRIVISDGVHCSQGMLATQLNQNVLDETLRLYDVLVLEEHVANLIQNRRVIIVLRYTPVGSAGSGAAPQQQQQQRPAAAQPPRTQPQAPAPTQRSTAPYGGANPSRPIAQSSGMPSGNFTPISALSPYNARWNIRVRITNKSAIRNWNNQRGSGQMFNIEMLDDQGGEMRATFFTEGVKKWYDVIEVNKVYSIQKGQIKVADKRFNRTNCEYEMTLDQNSLIELVSDGSADSIPRINYKFVPIANIENIEANKLVDVLAVVKDVRQLQELKSRKDGKDLIKRDIEIADQSGRAITLTFWGERAKMPEWDELQGRQPVIAVKSCKISDYNGKSLSTLNDSQVEFDPDRPEAFELRSWWDQNGGAGAVASLSAAQGGGGGSAIRPTDPRKPLSAVADEGLGLKEKPDVFVARAYIASIRPDSNHYYPSCPGNNGDCKKKLIFDQSQGRWRCEKCNNWFDAPIYRYILNMGAADHTAAQMISAYDTEGNLIFGISAGELNEIKEANPVQYAQLIQDCLFKRLTMKIRAKSEMWQDESRVKCGVIAAERVNYISDMELICREIVAYN